MARLIRALAELARAADARRSADKPSGALRAVSGYLVGLTVLSTAANAYAFFSVFRGLLSRADAYGVATLSATIACAPLVASLALSGGGAPAGRRLALLPAGRPTRLALAALGPLSAELPVIALASLLPAVAASPLAYFSAGGYALAVVGYAALSAGLALAARSVAAALAAPRTRAEGHGRAVAKALALGAIAAANPRTVVVEGGAALSVYGSYLLPAGRVDDRASPGRLACLALGALALAMAAALIEDASRRRAASGSARGRRPRGKPAGGTALPVVPAVVDGDRSFFSSLAAATALGVVSVAQGAPPAVPLVAALAILAVRAGSAFGFLAVENAATRRLALIPAAPGACERAYLRAAVAMAAAVAAPLLVSAACLALA